MAKEVDGDKGKGNTFKVSRKDNMARRKRRFNLHLNTTKNMLVFLGQMLCIMLIRVQGMVHW